MALAVSVSSIPALAANADASYGFLAGQQQNNTRHQKFEAAASLQTDEEREAFYSSQGIGGGGPYSSTQHFDVESLLTAGIINQKTADSIKNAASNKHDQLSFQYAGKANLTPDERQAFYEGLDDSDNDSVSGLLNKGIITQEQADRINNFLS